MRSLLHPRAPAASIPHAHKTRRRSARATHTAPTIEVTTRHDLPKGHRERIPAGAAPAVAATGQLALPRASTPPYAPRAPRANAWRRRRTKTAAGLQAPRTNNDARRRKDAACPHGHKAGDADRWGKRELGVCPGNGAPLRARVAAFLLPCERGLNSHTVVDTRPRPSLAL